jgi:hypothetical protein
VEIRHFLDPVTSGYVRNRGRAISCDCEEWNDQVHRTTAIALAFRASLIEDKIHARLRPAVISKATQYEAK